MDLLRIFLCIQLMLQYCSAHCPNMCNQHGFCGTDNTCTCSEGYSGLDCSLIPCDTGRAWTDKANTADSAHQETECSNAGICDTSTGKCKCFSGYSGTACQRRSCPNDCSNRGRCMSIRDASVYFGRDYNSASALSGDGVGFDYSVWDSRSMQICKCDYGYMGPDCSQVMCPKGDDPLTTGQSSRVIRLEVRARPGRSLHGDLGVAFHGEKIYLSLDTPSGSLCTASLKGSPQFQDVYCVYTSIGATMAFTITFNTWPRSPKHSNLYSHDGNPPLTDFYCDISGVDSATTCSFVDVVSTNLKEYEFCSNRGLCDLHTGECTCVDGFGGMACENITNRFSDDTNALVGKDVTLTNPTDFTSTVVQINVEKTIHSSFQHIVATANTTKVFEVRGDGQLGATELRVLSSGMTVARGGLQVESGGFTVATDGAYVYSHTDTTPGLEAAASHSSFTDDALEIRSESTSPSSTHLLRAYNRDVVRFSVRGDGHVSINGTGTQVTGGLTVHNGGLTVTDGVSVLTSGLKVTGGMSILDGGWYTTNGITIPQNGLKVTDGATIYNGLVVDVGGILVSAGGSDISEGGILITQDGCSIGTGGMKTTDGLTINGGGMTVTAGVSVITLGLKVTGGLTVFDDGFTGYNGLTVALGGMKVTGGLTINGGATVSGGITVIDSGLKVQAGASIRADGMTVVGGVTVQSVGLQTFGVQVDVGGIKSTGGLTVSNIGATVTGGLTVIDTGVYVEVAGFSIVAGGMKVVDGVTVSDTGLVVTTAGLQVTGGFSVSSVGMKVSGGMTIDNGLDVLLDGVTITFGGMKVGGGITVEDSGFNMNLNGIEITGGVTVQDVGAHVTGGLTVVNGGVFVTANGATISSGGLAVNGGFQSDELNIEAGGAAVTGGVSVLSAGMKVTGGVTFSSSSGLNVAAGGMTVASPGLKVNGGLTLDDVGLRVTLGGVRVTGGLSLADTGVTVTGGLTVSSSGMQVNAGGASVVGYLTVANGITVLDTGVSVQLGGMKVIGGLSVRQSSMFITGGLTLSDTGLTVSAGGATFSATGVKVAGGVTVSSNVLVAPDIIVTGTLTVVSGAVVTGGLTVVNTGMKVDTTGTNYITGTGSDVFGDLSISGVLNTNYVGPSDRRLKKDVSAVRDSLESITKLRGVYFSWARDSPQARLHKNRQIGLIAQDVQKVFPELITKIMGGDYLGMNYIQLIPVLVEAIRELDEMYTQLDIDYQSLSMRSQTCACRKKTFLS